MVCSWVSFRPRGLSSRCDARDDLLFKSAVPDVFREIGQAEGVVRGVLNVQHVPKERARRQPDDAHGTEDFHT